MIAKKIRAQLAARILLGLLFALAAPAAAADKKAVLATEDKAAEATKSGAVGTSYGELMLIEQKSDILRNWQIEVSMMQEFSNPYLDISGFSGSMKKSIGAFVHVGPEYTMYFTEDSDVNKNVTAALKTDTIGQSVQRPRDSMYGTVAIVPVAGHLNIFNRSALPFELEASFGYGIVRYENRPSRGALLWRIGPRAFLSELVGLQLQFGQEIESAFSPEKVTKSHARVGIVMRF